jgi:2-keto-4-pentenoate hydratase/2-oxohepta-3-ene-1,7-dioic acid hydratase in catechol pathway
MEALCDYESMSAEMLGCKAGDTFTMIAPVGRHWMKLRRDRDGGEGHLPVEFLAEMPAEPVSLVRAIADSGVTVLMIEHVMQAVMSLAEHVWVLAQGQLIAAGTPAEVTRHPQVIEAYLGHGTAARLRQAEVSA